MNLSKVRVDGVVRFVTLSLCVAALSLAGMAHAEAQTSTPSEVVVFGPQTYHPKLLVKTTQQSTFTKAPSAAAPFQIYLQNGSAKDYELKSCTQKGLLAKLACELTNVVTAAQMALDRVASGEIKINGTKVASFDLKTHYLTIPISNLNVSNTVSITIQGLPTSSVSVSIRAPAQANTNPVAVISPTPAQIVAGSSLSLNGLGSYDPDSGDSIKSYSWNFGNGKTSTLPSPDAASSTYSAPGQYTISLKVTDQHGGENTATRSLKVIANTPPVASIHAAAGTGADSLSVRFDASQSYDPDGLPLAYYAWDFGDATTGSGSLVDHTYSGAGTYNVRLSVTDVNGGTTSANQQVTVTVDVDVIVPADPSSQAPEYNLIGQTPMKDSTKFLYEGSDPVQAGVLPGAIDDVLASVIRGVVQKVDGSPLEGVEITVLNHPELGMTHSRADGAFDLAVNGGQILTLNFKRPGYLPSQRDVIPSPAAYATAPQVRLVGLDSKATVVSANSNTFQVIRSNPAVDADGTRTATVVIPKATSIEIVGEDGVSRTVSSLAIRATEYTVGESGPQAMPAALPPHTAYTYAVNLTADEAIAQNAKSVTFSQPLYYYVENFLNMPVGDDVPSGYYDQDLARWLPSDNGRVVKVLSIAGGQASLDVTGAGVPATAQEQAALGLTNEELVKIASLYSAGQTLWRVPISHFTPYDFNWSDALAAPPEAVKSPDKPVEQIESANVAPKKVCNASVIDSQRQTLTESLPVVGLSDILTYSSDRVLGYKDAYTIKLPSYTAADFSAAGFPTEILTEVEVAGRYFSYKDRGEVPSRTFTWDGLDAYSRVVNAPVQALVRWTFYYDGDYRRLRSSGSKIFAAFPEGDPLPNTPTRTKISVSAEVGVTLGVLQTKDLDLGGWSLTRHHIYDPLSKRLFMGDGSIRTAENRTGQIETIYGTGSHDLEGDGGRAIEASIGYPGAIAVGANGVAYIGDGFNGLIMRVDRNGIITEFGSSEDLPSVPVPPEPSGVESMSLEVGADGYLYVTDTYNQGIYRVNPVSGRITVIAGGGASTDENVLATQSSLNEPTGLAVDAKGGFYYSEPNLNRVRYVNPQGIVTTIAGTGERGSSGDGGLSKRALLDDPRVLALSANGELAIAESGPSGSRIRKILKDGSIITLAGLGTQGSGDGGPAKNATFLYIQDMKYADDGTLYIADQGRIRKIRPDGVIVAVSGPGVPGQRGDGGPAINASYVSLSAIAVTKDGNLLVADTDDGRVRLIKTALSPANQQNLIIGSADGSQYYVFSPQGRHLETHYTLTNEKILSFEYDSIGRLTAMVDADNNRTTISRDGLGRPTSITSPFGQVTTVTTDSGGYLATLTNPLGDRYTASYSSSGLLEKFRRPTGGETTFTYDSLGRLVKDQNPLGGFLALIAEAQPFGSRSVRMSTAEGRTSWESISQQGDTRTYRSKDTAGFLSTRAESPDGTATTTNQTGMLEQTRIGGHYRFGLQSPYIRSAGVKTPLYGLVKSYVIAETFSFADPIEKTTLASYSALQIDESGALTVMPYDPATRSYVSVSPQGRVSAASIDGRGRVIAAGVSGLESIQVNYGEHGLITSLSQGTRKFAVTYDSLGRTQSLTDPLGRVARYDYDLSGRLTAQQLPDSSVISYTYDGNGNLTSITPPGRGAHGFTVNVLDQITTYEPPAVAGVTQVSTQYAYNKDKQLTGILRPDGSQIALNYDQVTGQLMSMQTSEGSKLYAYSQETGQLIATRSPDLVQDDLNYDGDLLLSVNQSGPVSGSVHFGYNNGFTLASAQVNGETPITYSYDRDKVLTRAGDLGVTYDLSGLLSQLTIGSLTESFTSNTYGEVVTEQTQLGSTLFVSQNYTRDAIGRVSAKSETLGSQTNGYAYGYDTVGRLVSVHENGALRSSYAYDTNGNRLTKTVAGVVTSSSYDAQDRLLTAGTKAYAYNANGERVSKTDSSSSNSETYRFDTGGVLKQVVLSSGGATTTVDYVTDANDRRVGKKRNGALNRMWVYGGQTQILAELDSSGSIVSRFVYASRANVPDYMIRAGVNYKFITDQIGSVRLVVNTSNGAIAEKIDYDEFGNVLSDSNPGFQPFGFAGGLYDQDTKLVHFGAREYDPEVGRWLSKDPIGFAGGDTNLFGYVLNDPINFVDPGGTTWRDVNWKSLIGGTLLATFGTAAVLTAPSGILGVLGVSIGAPAAAAGVALILQEYENLKKEPGDSSQSSSGSSKEAQANACPFDR